MKIVMITGSPHRHGTSALLADAFIQGAQEAGIRCSALTRPSRSSIPAGPVSDVTTPTRAASTRTVWRNSTPICWRPTWWPLPLRFITMTGSAQLKLAIDRFYANSTALRTPKKAVLLLTMEDDTMESAAGAVLSFQGMTNYLGWERVGVISALSCGDLAAMERTDYPQQAYELGKNLR